MQQASEDVSCISSCEFHWESTVRPLPCEILAERGLLTCIFCSRQYLPQEEETVLARPRLLGWTDLLRGRTR